MVSCFPPCRAHGGVDQARGDLAPKVTSQEWSWAADTTRCGKIKDEHGGEATGGQAEGWMGACSEGQEGGEWMVSEQGWQQFGWETESLTSTQQSFSVILLRH